MKSEHEFRFEVGKEFLLCTRNMNFTVGDFGSEPGESCLNIGSFANMEIFECMCSAQYILYTGENREAWDHVERIRYYHLCRTVIPSKADAWESGIWTRAPLDVSAEMVSLTLGIGRIGPIGTTWGVVLRLNMHATESRKIWRYWSIQWFWYHGVAEDNGTNCERQAGLGIPMVFLKELLPDVKVSMFSWLDMMDCQRNVALTSGMIHCVTKCCNRHSSLSEARNMCFQIWSPMLLSGRSICLNLIRYVWWAQRSKSEQGFKTILS